MLRLSVSIGKGNTMVELCSVDIALSVCKQGIDHCEDEEDLVEVGGEQDDEDEDEDEEEEEDGDEEDDGDEDEKEEEKNDLLMMMIIVVVKMILMIIIIMDERISFREMKHINFHNLSVLFHFNISQ